MTEIISEDVSQELGEIREKHKKKGVKLKGKKRTHSQKPPIRPVDHSHKGNGQGIGENKIINSSRNGADSGSNPECLTKIYIKVEENKDVNIEHEESHNIQKEEVDECSTVVTNSKSNHNALTRSIVKQYAKCMEKINLKKEKVLKYRKSLSRHNISEDLRSKMVNWMIEVLNTFECSNYAFFKAVRIMDAYLKNSRSPLIKDDIHIVGVVSMFIASKIEDLWPLTMETVIAKIGHDIFTQTQLKAMEIEILKTFLFRLPYTSVVEYIESNVAQFKLTFSDKLTASDLQIILKIENMAIFYAKMATYEYSFLSLK